MLFSQLRGLDFCAGNPHGCADGKKFGRTALGDGFFARRDMRVPQTSLLGI